MTSKEALEGLIDAYISWRAYQTRECIENDYRYKKLLKDLDRLEELEKATGCPLEVREKALNGFYIPGYGYVSNNDDFIYLRKDDKGYYLKVVIHPSKPTQSHFYGYCDIHYLKDYKKTWFLKEDRSE